MHMQNGGDNGERKHSCATNFGLDLGNIPYMLAGTVRALAPTCARFTFSILEEHVHNHGQVLTEVYGIADVDTLILGEGVVRAVRVGRPHIPPDPVCTGEDECSKETNRDLNKEASSLRRPTAAVSRNDCFAVCKYSPKTHRRSERCTENQPTWIYDTASQCLLVHNKAARPIDTHALCLPLLRPMPTSSLEKLTSVVL